jgi:hypothetical protein
MKRIIKKAIQKIGRIAVPDDSQNLKIKMQRLSTKSTAEFILKEMSLVQSVDSWDAVHNFARKHVSVDGLILEFGVFSARTTNHIAQLFPEDTIHGFDSFEGLPEAWRDGFDKSRFAVNSLPKVLSNVELHKGWFNESIPTFLNEVDSEQCIAYLHVDCDLYSSTKTIFNCLKHLFVDGTIIVFDEYFNYPGWEQGEHLAFQEFLSESKFRFEWLTYNHLHEQVAIKLLMD